MLHLRMQHKQLQLHTETAVYCGSHSAADDIIWLLIDLISFDVIWQWRGSVVKYGVSGSVRSSNSFRRLEKLILPSVFDTSLSSLMMWNLQSYPTTVLNKRMWHFRGSKHILTTHTYFQWGSVSLDPYALVFGIIWCVEFDDDDEDNDDDDDNDDEDDDTEAERCAWQLDDKVRRTVDDIWQCDDTAASNHQPVYTGDVWRTRREHEITSHLLQRLFDELLFYVSDQVQQNLTSPFFWQHFNCICCTSYYNKDVSVCLPITHLA